MTRNISCFYYLTFKTNVLLVIYTVLTNILAYIEAAIPTWFHSSTYPNDTLAHYVS